MVYLLGEELIPTTEEEALNSNKGAVYIINEDKCAELLR